MPFGGPFESSSVVNLDKKLGIVYSPTSPPTENTFPLYSNMVEKGGLPILDPVKLCCDTRNANININFFYLISYQNQQ